jgi:hypothetical protein
LLALFDALRARLTRSAAAVAVALAMALLLSDNILWLGAFTVREEQGIRLTTDEQNLLGWLNVEENRGFIILSRTPRISYLAMTYTPLRSWFSHNNNTPQYHLRRAEAEAYFHDGVFLDRWKTTPLLIVHDNAAPSNAFSAAHSDPAMKQVFRNGTFTVIRHEPQPPG